MKHAEFVITTDHGTTTLRAVKGGLKSVAALRDFMARYKDQYPPAQVGVTQNVITALIQVAASERTKENIEEIDHLGSSFLAQDLATISHNLEKFLASLDPSKDDGIIRALSSLEDAKDEVLAHMDRWEAK